MLVPLLKIHTFMLLPPQRLLLYVCLACWGLACSSDFAGRNLAYDDGKELQILGAFRPFLIFYPYSLI